MHFLVTGGTGAGKTLFTLKWVRDLQLKTGRPVCYTKSLTLKPAAADFGWKQIDIKHWEKEPDGTIFIVDECHKDFPTRGGAGAPPPHIQNLAEARHRGFDFFFVTQHPKNLDVFIRRLIAAPGWHRHIKRRGGAPLSAVLQWDSVYERVEKNDSGESGGAEVSNQPYPKHVYDWYESTSMDTAKFTIPKAAIWMGIACIAGPALIWTAFRAMNSSPAPATEQVQQEQKQSSDAFGGLKALAGVGQGTGSASEKKTMTMAEFIDSHKPRLKDFPQTAPRYDAVTQPVVAPYPAACVTMGDRCDCFTQQGTLLPGTSRDVCQQIVKQGYFVDWQQPSAPAQPQAGLQHAVHQQTMPMQQARSVPVPGAAPVNTHEQEFLAWKKQKELDAAMSNLALRNAGPRLQGSLSRLTP